MNTTPNNNNNANNLPVNNENDYSISPTKQYSVNDPIFSNNKSFNYLSKPRRLEQYSKDSHDDDLIRLNTNMNKYIPVRSKSLPLNSLKLKSNLKSDNKNDNKARHHKRSKSVHFDEVLPVKMYSRDDCPTRVSRSNSNADIITRINFDNPKPLRRLINGYGEVQIIQDKKSLLGNRNNKKSIKGNSPQKDKSADKLMDGFYDFNFAILNTRNNISRNNNLKNKIDYGDLKLNIYNKLNNPNNNIILQNIKLEKRKTYDNLNDYFIWGKILVKNIFFHKLIYVRYTLNDWTSFNEVKAQYINLPIMDHNLVNFDVFEFKIHNLKNLIKNEGMMNKENKDTNLIQNNIQFCIHYETYDDQNKFEFWENNSGSNYKVNIVLHEREKAKKNISNGNLTNKFISNNFNLNDYLNEINNDTMENFDTLDTFNSKINNNFGSSGSNFDTSNFFSTTAENTKKIVNNRNTNNNRTYSTKNNTNKKIYDNNSVKVKQEDNSKRYYNLANELGGFDKNTTSHTITKGKKKNPFNDDSEFKITSKYLDDLLTDVEFDQNEFENSINANDIYDEDDSELFCIKNKSNNLTNEFNDNEFNDNDNDYKFWFVNNNDKKRNSNVATSNNNNNNHQDTNNLNYKLSNKILNDLNDEYNNDRFFDDSDNNQDYLFKDFKNPFAS